MKKRLRLILKLATYGLWLPLTAVAEKKKIVFLVGDDLTHKSGTHEFYAGGLLLKDSFEKSNYKDEVSCTVVNNWPEDLSVFDDADAVIHYYKGNKFHFMKAGAPYFQKLVEKGVGQMFMHYGVDPCDEAESSLKSWTGAVYKDKFSTNPHWLLESQLQKHPINRGVKKYTIQDEWYVNMDFESEVQVGYERPNVAAQVYSVMHGQKDGCDRLNKKLKRSATPAELTVFWAKESKEGTRGAGITGAHFHKNWAHDDFRKQVMNAIVWTAKLPVKPSGVVSPPITEQQINLNLDKRKRGGLQKITLASAKSPVKKDIYDVDNKSGKKGKVHPYFALENLDVEKNTDLKVGGMAFDGETLYIASFAPDRTNKSPDHQGKIVRVDHVLSADGKEQKIKTTTIVEGLYEPTGIAIQCGKLYVGTKTQILRFDQFKEISKPLTAQDAVVLLDGASTANFHTYTVGFEEYRKDGALYLCGNFTTAIQLGGRRDWMVPPNEKVHRGSTFILSLIHI